MLMFCEYNTFKLIIKIKRWSYKSLFAVMRCEGDKIKDIKHLLFALVLAALWIIFLFASLCQHVVITSTQQWAKQSQEDLSCLLSIYLASVIWFCTPTN